MTTEIRVLQRRLIILDTVILNWRKYTNTLTFLNRALEFEQNITRNVDEDGIIAMMLINIELAILNWANTPMH